MQEHFLQLNKFSYSSIDGGLKSPTQPPQSVSLWVLELRPPASASFPRAFHPPPLRLFGC